MQNFPETGVRMSEQKMDDRVQARKKLQGNSFSSDPPLEEVDVFTGQKIFLFSDMSGKQLIDCFLIYSSCNTVI